jgi:hypothetical protein
MGLAAKDPLQACQDAIAYVNSNAKGMPAITASTFCQQSGNSVTSTTCSGGALSEAMPTVTRGRFNVSIHYPVPDAEIADPRITGARLNDKLPCDRMRVVISATDPSFFGGIVGPRSYTTSRSATAVSTPGWQTRTPALWLLDPKGCTALSVGGGSDIEVGTSTVAGVVTLDSDGSRCTGSQYTVNVSGAGSKLHALDGLTTGYIGLNALPPGATNCTGSACDPANVSSGVLLPQPQAAGERATRAPMDWRFNCKSSYPPFPALQSPTAVYTSAPCPDTATRGPYIDDLNSALATAGTTAPAGYTTLTDCSPSGTNVYSGNYWVNCNSGYSIGNGTDVSFTGGNVIFTGDLKMTGGGSVTINAQLAGGTYNDLSNPISNLSGSCLSPGTGSPCLTASSKNAAFVYFTSGGLNFTGGSFHANHTAIVMTAASGQVKAAGGAPPTWTAPTEGPFAALSLWAEGKNGPFQINGGAGVTLGGAFFTPEGVMSISGGGVWAVPENAQFIAYQLGVSGGATLKLSPDPETAISAPPSVGLLIR